MSNWTCPYCNHAQAASFGRVSTDKMRLAVKDARIGDVGLEAFSLVCSNTECRELNLKISLRYWEGNNNGSWWQSDSKPIKDWRLLPSSIAKPQPDFIPPPLREDYYEACAIRDLSPKASATLSRRCLQGMIRDFCGIAKGTLDKEITALREALVDGSAPRGVTEESVDAIDAVRTVGNIGAHMEKDINLIIEVDPDEAQILIGLIESLFDEWYVARHRRQQKFSAVLAVAADKKLKIAELKALSAPNQTPSS